MDVELGCLLKKMTTHKLKTWPKYFEAILINAKTFEFRENDRDFQLGDTLVLQEWNPETKEYTNREIVKEVSYIMHVSPNGCGGCGSKYAVMSIKDKHE